MKPAELEAAKKELDSLLSSVLYTEKAHFAHEQRARRVYLSLGLVSTVAGSLTAVSVLKDMAMWIPTTFALVATICSALLTFVKPSDSAEAHAKSGRSLGALRVQMRQYRDLVLLEEALSNGKVQTDIAKFADDKADIDAVAEAISDRIYDRVSKKLAI